MKIVVVTLFPEFVEHALGFGVLVLPAHPVLVLRGDRERLVPLVPDRVLSVDLEAGRLTLDWHPDD